MLKPLLNTNKDDIYMSLEECIDLLSLDFELLTKYIEENKRNYKGNLSFCEVLDLAVKTFELYYDDPLVGSPKIKTENNRMIKNKCISLKIYLKKNNNLVTSNENFFRSISHIFETFAFKINEELYKEVYSGMPANYNNVEKMIFIYFKLCMLLQIDDAFIFAGLIDKNETKNFFAKNPNRLERISPSNNKVQCFEFVEILNNFFRELGGVHAPTTSYGSWKHVKFKGVLDGVLFEADSFNKGKIPDISKVKMGQGYLGIKLTRKDSYDFKDEIRIVYNDVQRLFPNKKRKENYELLQNLTNLVVSDEFDFNLSYNIFDFGLTMSNLNLTGYEFYYVIEKCYKDNLETKTNNNVRICGVCFSCDLKNYKYGLIICIKKRNGEFGYLLVDEPSGKVIPYTKEQIIEEIREGKLIVVKNDTIDTEEIVYNLIPDIPEDIQLMSNEIGTKEKLPIILKGVLEESIKNHKSM